MMILTQNIIDPPVWSHSAEASCGSFQYGYTTAKIKRKYSKFNGDPIYVCLNKGTNGLGLSLAGHKDRRQVHMYSKASLAQIFGTLESSCPHLGTKF
jgi:hypothetical protein